MLVAVTIFFAALKSMLENEVTSKYFCGWYMWYLSKATPLINASNVSWRTIYKPKLACYHRSNNIKYSFATTSVTTRQQQAAAATNKYHVVVNDKRSGNLKFEGKL